MSNIGGVIKSIRDIFRKDPGLSGDAKRIEQLGWMLFLKIFPHFFIKEIIAFYIYIINKINITLITLFLLYLFYFINYIFNS